MNQIAINTKPKRGAPVGNKNASLDKSQIVYKSVIESRLAKRGAMVLIADMLIDRAIDGDLRATEILLDRVMGKATTVIESNSTETIKHEHGLSDNTLAMLENMKQAIQNERVVNATISNQVSSTVSIVLDADHDA